MSAVYFIQAGGGGPIKIGCSSDPAERLAQLQVGNPVELRLLAAIEFDRRCGADRHEKDMHTVFEAVHIRGEWYEPAPELLHLIWCVQNSIHGDIEPVWRAA